LPAMGPTMGTVTDYYFQASCGDYIVLGDYLPQVITVTAPSCIVSDTTLVATVGDVLNKLNSLNAPIVTAHNQILADFDNYEMYNNGNWHKGKVKPTTTASGSKIDAILVVWRNSNEQKTKGQCVGGYGLQDLGYHNISIQNMTGIEMGASFNACESNAMIGTTITEYMHGLFGGNNWHSGGGQGPYTFIGSSAAFCTTANSPQVSICPCGFDRNHLGWKFSNRTNLISSLDATKLSEVNSDITIQNTPNGGEFILRDFMTVGDLIRVQLPHINNNGYNTIKNQYIWLENHQKISMHEKGLYDDVSCYSPWKKGLWSYMQVGKNRKIGNTSTDDIFVESEDVKHINPNYSLDYF
ncbi:MAG: hypothetical protein RIQ33_105, partial [Bacteroidota bacterium]